MTDRGWQRILVGLEHGLSQAGLHYRSVFTRPWLSADFLCVTNKHFQWLLFKKDNQSSLFVTYLCVADGSPNHRYKHKNNSS